jgi:HSP20 family protein
LSSESGDIDPFDWFRKFMRGSGFGRMGGGGGTWPRDIFAEFDQIRRQMERGFEEQFGDIQTKTPKELVREYETPEGRKVKEFGPFVYGHSMTIGPDGKPKVREFGNIKSPLRNRIGADSFTKPLISSEREPLTDMITTDKEVKVVVELPGVNKENIKVNAYDNTVEVTTVDSERKYHEVIEIPPETDIETAKSTYKNGILEIIFNKKQQSKPNEKQIKIE